jgi:mannosyltransferase
MTTATAEAPSPTSVRPPWRSPVVIAAVGIGLGTFILSSLGSWVPSLWGDEVTSAMSAERPLPTLFAMLGHIDAVHGTYYLFLHFWVEVFGSSPFSIRFPSAIATGIAAGGVVVLGRRLATVRTGITAGIVFAVIPRTTYMGEEARGYAMSAACAVWLSILLVSLLQARDVRRARWAVYAIGVALCAYVFLFSLLLLVAHAVIVVSMRRPGLARTWIKATAGGLALALPVIVYGVAERGQIAFLTDRTAATFGSVAVGQWFTNAACATVAWALIAAAIVVPAITWLRERRSLSIRRPSLVVLAAVWGLAPTVILLSVNAVHAIYSSRYLSFCVPAIALLIGSLLGRIQPRWLPVGLVLALGATASTSYLHDRTPYAKNASDWAADASVIQSHARPGQGVLFDESTKPSTRMRLAMRGYPQAFVGLKDIGLTTPWFERTTWSDAASPLSDVLPRLDNLKTVWVIEYRAAHAQADTYDLATLQSQGFTELHRYKEYRSDVIEYRR